MGMLIHRHRNRHNQKAEAPAEDTGPLKGKALDDALEAAGLPKSGTADEKRARLAEHEAAQAAAAQTPTGDGDGADTKDPGTPDEGGSDN